MTPRFTWTETAKGNWICTSGAYAGVLERRGAVWDLRVKSPGPMIYGYGYADLAIAKADVQQRIAWQADLRTESHLLEHEPPHEVA